jgi:hypothetical protein
VVLSLIAAGFLLELAGIGLALREIRERRRAVKAYRARPARGYAAGTLSFSSSASGSGGSSGAEPPSLETRVAALEQAIPALRAEQEASARRSMKHSEAVAKSQTDALGRYLGDTIADIRALLLVATAPTPGSWWSVGLLIAGLVAQTWANVV